MRHFLMGILALTVCLCLLAGCGSAARYTDGGYTPATTAATTAEEEISLCGTWKLNSTDATFANEMEGVIYLTLAGENFDTLDDESYRYLFEKQKITMDMMKPVVKKFCDNMVLHFDERGTVRAMIDSEICKECYLETYSVICDALGKCTSEELAKLLDLESKESLEDEEKRQELLTSARKIFEALERQRMEDTASFVSAIYGDNATLNANGMIEFSAVSYSQNGKYATIEDEKCSAVRNIKVVKAGSGARIADAAITIDREVEQFSTTFLFEKGMRLERVSA